MVFGWCLLWGCSEVPYIRCDEWESALSIGSEPKKTAADGSTDQIVHSRLHPKPGTSQNSSQFRSIIAGGWTEWGGIHAYHKLHLLNASWSVGHGKCASNTLFWHSYMAFRNPWGEHRWLLDMSFGHLIRASSYRRKVKIDSYSIRLRFLWYFNHQSPQPFILLTPAIPAIPGARPGSPRHTNQNCRASTRSDTVGQLPGSHGTMGRWSWGMEIMSPSNHEKDHS